MPELDVGSDYREKLVYKHSARGAIDRNVNRIKRKRRQWYIVRGVLLGLALGFILALVLAALLV